MKNILEKDRLKSRERIWELDFLKGIALFLMILNHIFFDLSEFFSVDVSGFEGFSSVVGKASAVIFMTVCGISATLGKRNVQNGLRLFALAMALTAATAVFDRVAGTEVCIKFGILHFLSLAMMISQGTKKLPVPVLLIASVFAFALGKYFSGIFVNTPLLFPLGLRTRLFFSGDYYPLFPNLGFVFLGNALGKILYKERKSVFKKKFRFSEVLCLPGRHTLVLYFVHQPIIILFLFLISLFPNSLHFVNI